MGGCGIEETQDDEKVVVYGLSDEIDVVNVVQDDVVVVELLEDDGHDANVQDEVSDTG